MLSSIPFTTVLALFASALAIASPLAEPAPAVPFSGKGQLLALHNGTVVGCMTSALAITVNLKSCAKFTSTYSPSDLYVTLKSSKGACGPTFVGYDPSGGGAENVKWAIGCGGGVQRGSFQASVGRKASVGWTVLAVQYSQRHFTTKDFVKRDDSLPTGKATRPVFTNEWMGYQGYDFELGWKAV